MSNNQKHLNKQYCTYLTHYIGDKLPKWYIGSTSIKNISNGYNGSVKSKKYKTIWNLERKNNPHLFKTRILRKFYRRKIATIHELKLQKLHKVVKNDKYINMSYASINGFFGRDVSGENNPMYGKKFHKENNPFYGKKHSKETKDKIRNTRATLDDTIRIDKFNLEMNKEFIKNGKMTSKIKESVKKTNKTIYKKSQKYNLFHIEVGLLHNNISKIELRKIHRSLNDAEKGNYLGKHYAGKAQLIKFNKSLLIGLYVEKI